MISPLVLWDAPDNTSTERKLFGGAGGAARRPYDRAIIPFPRLRQHGTCHFIGFGFCAGRAQKHNTKEVEVPLRTTQIECIA
jgi:hypothetical protein